MFNVNILFAVLIDDGRVIDDLYFCIRIGDNLRINRFGCICRLIIVLTI